MMEDGIPPSLRGSVDAFVASGGIPTRGHGVRHVGIFVGTRLPFVSVKTPLDEARASWAS
jgi:hypothetical protein